MVLQYAGADVDQFASKFCYTAEKNELSQDKEIKKKFMEVLNNGDIKTVFQPIISLKNGSILGYEALSRGPQKSILENPAMLFDLAKIYGKLWELELLCRIKALENAAKWCPNACLFLNVDPATINDDKFKKGFTKDFLKKYDISPQNIVFEITEKNAVSDYRSFRKTINNYKDQGYKIAIDDTGTGYSGLTMIAEIHPHFIKLDMNLIRNIDKNGLKSALIKTFYEFCLITDIKLIAEGIETRGELNALIDLGIDYGQGYFIQKPSSDIKEIDADIITQIKNHNKKKGLLYFSKSSDIFIGDVCRHSMCVASGAAASEVLDVFTNNPSMRALPVVNGDKVQGLVMKENFFAKLGTKYGFALYLNRPISKIMDNQPLIVEYKTKIDVVSRSAMTRGDEHLYDNIIVTKNGKYYGIVTVKDLLEKTTELEVNYAKHLNPLSGLPGNILIEIKLKEYLEEDKPFTVLYIDIDNFKVYNDVYGFENGDNMLLTLARVVNGCVSKDCSLESFAGHIGGDDFVIVVEGYEAQALCDAIIAAFIDKLPDFYSDEDLGRGFITAKNRHGVEERFGHVTLSIAGVTNKDKQFQDVFELSEYATKIKKKCKEIWDNYVLIK